MRHAILEITDSVIADIYKLLKPDDQSWRVKVIENALPADTKAIKTVMMSDSWQGTVGIVIESKEFDDIDPGDALPILPPPVMTKEYPEDKPDCVWVVGKFISYKEGCGVVWDFQGVFETEEEANLKCIKRNYFVGPVEVGVSLPDEQKTWPGCYYPRLEEKDDE